ncbi:MAG TPA: AAA domain-containing protein [Frankiaceae bacterium]|nr:AAA domain-containing protein [Frankiaceae bacterium]
MVEPREDALRAMAGALRAEVETLRADRTLQGRTVTGGARVGTSGKRTTYAFPDVPGAGLPDDTPIRLLLDDGREVDGEVATRNDRELVVALAEDVGAVVEHAVLVADASFLLERLATRLEEVLDDEAPLDLDLVAKVLGLEPGKSGRVLADAPELNPEQADALSLALGSEVTFVWGPPGTGKTTTVAHVVATHARKGRSVLLVSNTNAAVDTALTRVAALLGDLPDGAVVRYGTVVRPEVAHLAADAVSLRVAGPLLAERADISRRLDDTDQAAAGQGMLDADHDLGEERSRLRDRLDDIDRAIEAAAAGVARDATVVATTVYQTWLGGVPDRDFDVVVVDEASMLMLPMTAYAAGLASASVVVAGDFRQLPAIVSDTSPEVVRWLATDAFHFVGLPDLLAAGERPPWLAALRTQYRMRPAIADLVSALFYDDNPLLTGRAPDPSTPVLLGAGEPLVYVDTAALGAWAGVAGGRGSRFNPVHAVLVAALLDRLDEGTAGVVTPYAAQERLVAALLTDRFGDAARGWVSTVHRFQGGEQDVVVVDLADTYGASPGPASRAVGRDDPLARLLNVAVSRARDQLVVLGDSRFLAERTPARGTARALFRALAERGTALDVRDVLRGAFSLVPADRLVADLETAVDEVALFSPRVTGHGMARWSPTLRALLGRGVAVRVVTRPPGEQPRAAALLAQMADAGVAVDLWAGMEERVLTIDTDLTWLGGMDLGCESEGSYLRVRGSALPTALADVLRPAKAPRRPLGAPTNDPCPRCDGPTVLKRGGGAAAYVCLAGRDCPGLREVSDDDRDDKPDTATGPCRQPGCTGWLVRREGRFGPFTSCTRYPACTGR